MGQHTYLVFLFWELTLSIISGYLNVKYLFNIYATLPHYSLTLKNKLCLGMSCCGNNYTKSDGCCNQTTPFNRTHSRCVRDKVVPLGHDYCNGTLFNRQKQTCCEDSTLWNISSNDRRFRCCGSEMYDKRTKQCCRGSGEKKIQPKNGQCCGTGKYNIFTVRS